MPENISYPFEFENIFLITIQFSRNPGEFRNVPVEMNGQTKIILRNDQGKLQINFRLFTKEGAPLHFDTETVCLFKHLSEKPETDLDLLMDFINKRALILIIAYTSGMLKQLHAMLALGETNFPIPIDFTLRKEDLFPLSLSETPAQPSQPAQE